MTTPIDLVAEPIDPTRAQDAFDRVFPKLAKVKHEDLIVVSLDPIKAAMVALATGRTLSPSLDRIVSTLSNFKKESLIQLEDLALALWHAVIQERNEGDPAYYLSDILPRATKLKADLLTAAVALSARGRLPASVVEDYSAGTGHEDLANDLAGLADLFKKNWAELENRTDITAEELEEASSLGATILARVAIRKVAAADPARKTLSAKEVRRRVFALLYAAYEEVRRGAAATFWYEPGGWEKYAPSLWSAQGRGSYSRTETKAVEPAPVDPAAPAAPKKDG